MKPRAGSKALIREINEALVLDIVRTQAPVSRAKITVQTGLERSQRHGDYRQTHPIRTAG